MIVQGISTKMNNNHLITLQETVDRVETSVKTLCERVSQIEGYIKGRESKKP